MATALFPIADFEGEVTQILIQSDSRENARRMEEEKRREARRVRKEMEKEESDRHNAEIASKWGLIMEKSIPEELLKEIDTQKAQCEEVIASKDRLVKECRQETKAKEDEYQKLLVRQGEETDHFIDKMRKQFAEAKKYYETQLANAEQAMNEERKSYLTEHQSELTNMMEKRQHMEVQFMEWKQGAIEDDMRQIEQLMVMDAEEYNILKIKLETEIQTLEQQLQEMRATYQLNNEKLEYNFRLLHEREYDHAQQIQQQKKKINRLQDMLSTVRAKYTKLDKKYRQKNIELTEEYKRMTEQYKDLQNKLTHFQEYDTQKYTEVWNMSMDRVQEGVQQVLKADKVIHEQLLTLNWYPPQADIFAPPVKRLGSSQKQKGRSHILSSTSTSSSSLLPSSSAPVPIRFATPSSSSTSLAPSSSAPHSSRAALPGQRLSDVLGLIRQEATFLAKAGLSNERPEEIDSAILKALKVENEIDVQRLISEFAAPQGGLIPHRDVVAALTAFIRKRDEEKEAEEKEAKEATRRETKTEEGNGNNDDMVKEFWERIAKVIPDGAVLVWERLEDEMQKYNGLLKERVGLLQGNDDMRRQNDELKNLLNQYLSAKINEELLVPPVALPARAQIAAQGRAMAQGGAHGHSSQRSAQGGARGNR